MVWAGTQGRHRQMYDIATSQEMKADEAPPKPEHPDYRFKFAAAGTQWELVSSSWQATRTITEQVSATTSESTHVGRWVWIWEARPVL